MEENKMEGRIRILRFLVEYTLIEQNGQPEMRELWREIIQFKWLLRVEMERQCEQNMWEWVAEGKSNYKLTGQRVYDRQRDAEKKDFMTCWWIQLPNIWEQK
jgi:hypothetical protein